MDEVTVEVVPLDFRATKWFRQIEPPAAEPPDPREWTLTIGPDPAELETLIMEDLGDEPLPEENKDTTDNETI